MTKIFFSEKIISSPQILIHTPLYWNVRKIRHKRHISRLYNCLYNRWQRLHFFARAVQTFVRYTPPISPKRNTVAIYMGTARWPLVPKLYVLELNCNRDKHKYV